MSFSLNIIKYLFIHSAKHVEFHVQKNYLQDILLHYFILYIYAGEAHRSLLLRLTTTMLLSKQLAEIVTFKIIF